jgi:hypothetical protein
MKGQYQYYSYYLDYEARDEDTQVKALPTKPSSGAVVRAAGD